MGEALNPKYDGEMAIIDGFTGTLYMDPDEETMERCRRNVQKDLEQKALLNQLKGKENVTKSGQKINVYANIGNVSILDAVLKNDAGGIGLFRSEFLYLENSTYPTEEQQFAAYKQVAERMAGKKVIIRTLDIGADKQVDYFNLAERREPGTWIPSNPYLSDKTGDLQDSASCTLPCIRIWKSFHHVPDDHFCKRSS